MSVWLIVSEKPHMREINYYFTTCRREYVCEIIAHILLVFIMKLLGSSSRSHLRLKNNKSKINFWLDLVFYSFFRNLIFLQQ